VTITVTPTLEPIGQVLTPEEYDALPENPRREFVDGVVHMMATPSLWHQTIAFGLRVALNQMKPADLKVTAEVEVCLRRDLRRNPDVMVVKAGGYERLATRVQSDQVVMAGEVVSPGSESTDRVLKPIEYAKAGIPHFWRVEIDPEIVVNTYRLSDSGEYVQTGVFTKGDTVSAPGLTWARVAVSALGEAE
jgi:Uma2 family endonuclease